MRLLKTCALAVAGLFFAASASADYEGVPRTFLWNPGSVDIYDAAEHMKDGPYVIGFSNASLSNPWRVAMLHGIEAAAERNKDKLARFIITDANDNPRSRPRTSRTCSLRASTSCSSARQPPRRSIPLCGERTRAASRSSWSTARSRRRTATSPSSPPPTRRWGASPPSGWPRR